MRKIIIIVIFIIVVVLLGSIAEGATQNINLEFNINNIEYDISKDETKIEIEIENKGKSVNISSLVIILFDENNNEYAQTKVNACKNFSENGCQLQKDENIIITSILGFDATKTTGISYKLGSYTPSLKEKVIKKIHYRD